jgi:diaminohydroxyphosphoribosylaminopyrimidine deaminase/5-amino-6-(5-phosphoribosylamino)uracil reductase
MHRCIELARQGAGYVAPNPMVGAVLVYKDRIIGEGYHPQYGAPHAEVNCIRSVKPENADKIADSVLYVSLEPCSHYGKTPPCTDLLLQHKIKKVVIGSLDPNKEISGGGAAILKAGGVETETGILEKKCIELNKRFFTFHTQHRPYVILKWAQTADGKIAGATTERILISGETTNRLVHKWRSEEASILIGTHTALLDDPELTTRKWPGPSPVRLVVDMELQLPSSLKIFNSKQRTIIFNTLKQEESGFLTYYQVTEDASLVHQVVNALYQMSLQSVLVEGGARLLQSFIEKNMWDEARIICNKQLAIGKGLPAPHLPAMKPVTEITIENDEVTFYYN